MPPLHAVIRYKQRREGDLEIDPVRCRAEVELYGELKQCGQWRQGGSLWCHIHNPEAVEQRRRTSAERLRRGIGTSDVRLRRRIELLEELLSGAAGWRHASSCGTASPWEPALCSCGLAAAQEEAAIPPHKGSAHPGKRS